ncbi:hypothetical protein JQ616_10845 [Bradyrhizobium tropiciagri]|uniref:hypothetical protein n=1 Tax=Bradyrhizobium tropiciagri TaxID=312253 RepID=UPI001BABD8C8|nr:hypothetical protein [Bradyrhizobium tropiciagri]MBR0895445.1 hypothetical protein [Bradyrhizobium tropiciagri]
MIAVIAPLPLDSTGWKHLADLLKHFRCYHDGWRGRIFRDGAANSLILRSGSTHSIDRDVTGAWKGMSRECETASPPTPVIARLDWAIQYTAASQFKHCFLWNTGSPAFAGDDTGGVHDESRTTFIVLLAKAWSHYPKSQLLRDAGAQSFS